MPRPSFRRVFSRFLALSALATIASCGSAPASEEGGDRAGGPLGATVPFDPEAARAEMERAKAERRQVVESTLRWIVGETEDRSAPSR